MEGNDDWEQWQYGTIPLAVLIVGTYLVYRFFWRREISSLEMGREGDDDSDDEKEEGSPKKKVMQWV